jgi:hypothetical protein
MSRRSNLPVSLACAGLALGGLLRFAGEVGPANAAWTATIAVGMAYSLYSTGRSLAQGRLGVDLIALLALIGTALVHEYLAGAVVSVMLTSGGASSAGPPVKPTVIWRRCSSASHARPIDTSATPSSRSPSTTWLPATR